MNVIAINGSPRKNGNTITLLKEALKGAESQGVQTQQVDLYDLKYKGCVSCFYCKRKDRPHGTCAMRDDLSPLLEKLKAVDAVIFGSPIYYDNITSGMTAFLERFLFSNYIYSEDIPTVFPKKTANRIYLQHEHHKRTIGTGSCTVKLGKVSAFYYRGIGT